VTTTSFCELFHSWTSSLEPSTLRFPFGNNNQTEEDYPLDAIGITKKLKRSFLNSMTHNPLVIAASGSMVVLSWPQFTLAQSANRIHEPLGDAQADITLADDSADILT